MSYRDSLPPTVVQELEQLRRSSDWMEDVLRQLDRILQSHCFERVQAPAKAFLAHVVAQVLLGKSEQIKEQTIALAIIREMGQDYDPAADSRIRVAGGDLRQRLNQYYASEGGNDPIRIALPPKSFAPHIEELHPVITIGEFKCFDLDGATSHFSQVLGPEILRCLKASGAVRTRSVQELVDPRGTAHFELRGSFTAIKNRVEVYVMILDIVGQRTLSTKIFIAERSRVMGLCSIIGQHVIRMIVEGTKGWTALARIPEVPETFAAVQAYQRGQAHLRCRTAADIKLAAAYFEEAIDYDRRYGRAYSGLASCLLLQSWYASGTADRSWFDAGKAHAMTAVTLQPGSADAHASLGFALLLADFCWVQSEEEYQKAIKIDARHAQAHHWYAELLVMLGRFDEASSMMRRAFKLDSGSPLIRKSLGDPYYYSGAYGQAIEHYTRALTLHPDFWMSHLFLGWALQQVGENDKALREFETVAARTGGNSIVWGAIGHLHATTGNEKRALDVITKLQAEPNAATVAPHTLAVIHAGLGDLDRAFGWLDASFDQRIELLGWINVDPRFASIRRDPRFDAFLGRIGLHAA